MTDGLRTERSALPLTEAAARLGMSAEALRKRVERGEARGFDRDGELFVYVGESPAERRFGGGATDPGLAATGARANGVPLDAALPVVVEFQKMELDRLLRENERLNTRLDRLMDEIRHLRDMQQQEQVLRRQDQSLRRQIQETLDHLANRLALPPPRLASRVAPRPAAKADASAGAVPEVAPTVKPTRSQPADPRPELVLTRTVTTKKTPGAASAGAGNRPGSSGAFLAAGRTGQWRREPHALMPKAAPERPAAPSLSAAPASVENGGIAPEEAAELAEILTDIGRSLRDSEAFRRFPPVKPVPAPQRAGDRRPADQPLIGEAPQRPVQDRAGTGALPAEEKAVLTILDSMGLSAEDRRAAAGKMRRLLRSRMPPRRQEP